MLAHVFLLAVSVALAQSSVPSTTPQTPPKRIEIKGAKTPELIPDYLVWQAFFRLISRRDAWKHFEDGAGRMPGLSDEDRQILYKVADENVRRDADCDTRKNTRFYAGKAAGESLAALDQELRQMTMQCRIATIEAVDAMLLKMAESSRGALLARLIEDRKSISVSVLDTELAFFRLPR